MSTVTLTKFIDFVCKSGTPKLTVVKNWKHRPDYTPATDFYKRFRDAAVEMHEQGSPPATLKGVLAGLHHAPKREHYPQIVDGYLKWLGRKSLRWFEPPSFVWTFNTLEVSVNPELGLEINGVPHLIKLYMKTEPLAKNRIDLISNLMTLACGSSGHVTGVLDVRRSRLFTPPAPDSSLVTQLEGEAAYWCQVYEKL